MSLASHLSELAQAQQSKPANAATGPQPTGRKPKDRGTRYGLEGLRRECAAVATAPEGERNNTLNNAALAAGQLVAGGELAEDFARAELVAAATSAGLGGHEVAATIRSGMESGKRDPRQAPPRDDAQSETVTRPGVATVAGVIGGWLQSGPLVHEPTGIARLDELTGGGPVYGSRWYLAGAPDAGKTALLLQVAHALAERGVVVGLLAVDEEPGDVVTRLAQRIGYQRHHCEARDPRVLEKMRSELSALPIRFYDAGWTIEAAAADLATHAGGARAMLGVDSVQTVRCDAETAGRDLSEVAAVTARVQAIRAVATKHRLIVIATSEMGRGAYSSSDRAQQSSTMASGKWSGAIEYSARVLLGVRSVQGEPDLMELEVAKNKHGPRDQVIYLKIDRKTQTLTETAYEPPPSGAARARGDEAAREKVAQDARAVARALRGQPGLTVRGLRSAVKAATGAGHDRVDAAVALLGSAIVKGKGARGATPLTLDASLLPESILKELEV
jgi:hypothetical protein